MPTSRRRSILLCSRAHLALTALVLGLLLTTAVPAAGFTLGCARLAPGTEDLTTDLFRKEPYLIFPGDSTRMQVLWQLTATATSTIEWGPDTTYTAGSSPTTEYGSDHQHTWTITGLTPGQRYFYRVTATGTSRKGSFNAAPAASATRVKFLAYGDTRTYPATHDQVAARMISSWVADPAFQTLVLVVGDLVGSGDIETDWTDQFFSPAYPNIRSFTAQAAFQSCIGNHEGSGALFVKYFPYPFAGGRYWSFDYGPAHFVVVDQYTSYAPGSAQLQWIANDLAGSNKPWKFMCLHAPGWSAGGGHENNTDVQNYLQPLCVQYGVSIVFGGHNHYYARAYVSGVHHVTTGGGGAPLYTPNLSYPNVVAGNSAHHFCKVDINESTLTFHAMKSDGTLLDAFTIERQSAVPPVGPTASTLGATPNPFSRETSLSWRASGLPGECLLILDALGRLIRRLPAAGAGAQTVRWDGTDDRGQPVAPGVYFYRPDPQAGSEEPARVVLVR